MEDAITSETTTLRLDQVRLDGGTQARAAVSDETVADYAAAMTDGIPFEAVGIVYDGQRYWLWDGFHRHAARVRAGFSDIEAVVRQGTQRDAVLLSIGANARHGLRRTGADKRRAVLRLLTDDEWAQWSNREIARKAGVSKGLVDKMRRELRDTGSVPEPTSRIGGDGKVYPVGGPATDSAGDPWQPGARFSAETSAACATVRALAGAPLARDTWEVTAANAVRVVVVAVGKSGKLRAASETQLDRELADRLAESLAWTPPAPTSPFPDGCTSAKARIAHAETLASSAAVSVLLAVEGLQKSAQAQLGEHHKKLSRVEAADRAALMGGWDLKGGNNAPGLEAALLARLEALANETGPLTPIASDAQHLDEVAELDTIEDAERAMFQVNLPRAVRQAALKHWRRFEYLGSYSQVRNDDPPGVRRAIERVQAEAEAEKKRLADIEHYAKTMGGKAVAVVVDFVGACDDADKLTRWLEVESHERYQRFDDEGRADLRDAIAARLGELGHTLTPCPVCVSCWCSDGAWGRCMRCRQTPERALELKQRSEDAGHQLVTLMRAATPADTNKMRRTLLEESIQFEPTAWLLDGEVDDVRGFLAEAATDDFDELRELMVIGEMVEADMVLMGEIQRRHDVLLAEAAHTIVEAAAEPAPGPIDEVAARPEPVAGSLPEAQDGLSIGPGGRVVWSTEAPPDDAAFDALDRLLRHLGRAATAVMPPAWLMRDPTMLALLNAWAAAGAPRPMLAPEAATVAAGGAP